MARAKPARHRSGKITTACSPRSGLLVLAVALMALFLSPLSPAAREAGPPGHSRLALEVYINDQPTKLIAEIWRAPDGRLMAKRKELGELGIGAPGQGTPEELIAIEAMPRVSSRYVETEQKLYLDVPDELRLAKAYDIRTTTAPETAPDTKVSRDVGMVVNYNAYGTTARGYSGAARTYNTGTLSLDTRAFSPYGVLQNSAILGTSLARQSALRLESSFVYAHRETATNTTLGDAISGGLNWTRPVRFGGAQVNRSFGLRPDIITAALPSVSGSAAVPSTVDVYVDNMRIASQEVGAGPYRLTNIPVSGESGTARVVVRDITGKETATALPFFTSAKILAPGTFDFSLDAGYPRLNYALESFDYSKKFMAQGSYRYGLTDRLTLEGHAEGTQKLGMGGGGVTFGAGRLGTLSLAGAGSWNAGTIGGLGNASWQASWNGIFLGLSSQRAFGKFKDVAAVTATNLAATKLSGNFLDSGYFVLNRSADVPRALDRLSIGKSFSAYNASLTASLINVERTRGDVSRLASMTWSQTLAQRYNTFVTVFSDFGTQRQTGVVAGLSFTFNDNLTATTSIGTSGRDRAANFDLTRPLGTNDYDYGWRLYDNEGKNTNRGAQVSGRTPYGSAGAGVRQDGAAIGGYGEIDGAAILSPSGIFATRRVQDAFAIVDVGVPGVEVLHENRPVGRSGPRGKVIVTDVQSFQRTKITLSPDSLPAGAHATITEAEIIPGFRGSATVNARTIAARDTARIEIRDGAGQHLPPGTRVVHEESGHPFTIGYGGITFMPEIGDTNTLKIQMDTRSCTLRFARADRQGPKGLVGPLTCALQ